MKRVRFSLWLILILSSIKVNAQKDSIKYFSILNDTVSRKMNMDAVYNRPFITLNKMPMAIGGYMESNLQYAITDGVTEGLAFQMRRMTLFFSSTISQRLKFLSELEFEDGTKEINLEYAAMDLELHQMLNMRGGIVMNPIGSFNQNHDGPKWDFIDRPISSTTIIPSTLSNVGLGLYGKMYHRRWNLGYEAYLTNGFDDKVISNQKNKTSLAEGKLNPLRFEESTSGIPFITAKLAASHRIFGEFGISYMSGVYNSWRKDGIIIDYKRQLHILAFDFNASYFKNKFNINAEICKVWVDIPKSYGQIYANQQWGGYTDLVYTCLEKPFLDWKKTRLNLLLRLEYADYNSGKFKETNTSIGDHIWSMVPGISFRPVGTTVIRLNYRYLETKDLFNNPPSITAVYQFGLSTYF